MSTSTWLTPEDLAEEMGRPVRWVRDHMNAGTIPSVKVGGRRFFTPECRAELHARNQAAQKARQESWGLVTR